MSKQRKDSFRSKAAIRGGHRGGTRVGGRGSAAGKGAEHDVAGGFDPASEAGGSDAARWGGGSQVSPGMAQQQLGAGWIGGEVGGHRVAAGWADRPEEEPSDLIEARSGEKRSSQVGKCGRADGSAWDKIVGIGKKIGDRLVAP